MAQSNGRSGVVKLLSSILTERGLGTLISLILICAMLWLGVRLLEDMRHFQNQMVAEAARTNEKLEQLQVQHLEMKIVLERIERVLLTQAGEYAP